jgi:hypothetical protein
LGATNALSGDADLIAGKQLQKGSFVLTSTKAIQQPVIYKHLKLMGFVQSTVVAMRRCEKL